MQWDKNMSGNGKSVVASSVTAQASAPVGVFAFNRLDLLQRTLSALEVCDGFRSTEVHVFSDAAREDCESDPDEVAQVRSWLEGWCLRHGATLHEAATNQGLRRSITSGVSALLKDHDRVIVLEDDIVVAPRFLTFMNGALDAYRDRAEVFQVSGYFIPHSGKLPPIGLLGVPACWGWATWQRAWQHYRDDAAQLLSEVGLRDVHAFDIRGSYGYLDALRRNAEGSLDTWFVRWYASVFLHGGLTVYPGQSLTRNIGFGDRGTNCGPGTTAHVFLTQQINMKQESVDWNSLAIEETASFSSALEGFYRWQQYQWTKPTWGQRLRARLSLVAGKGPRA